MAGPDFFQPPPYMKTIPCFHKITGYFHGKKSGYSNCVVAISAESFIGGNLKYEGEAERKTLKTEKCIELDQMLDGADGQTKGRVRWVECSMGPDCDEAGMN